MPKTPLEDPSRGVIIVAAVMQIKLFRLSLSIPRVPQRTVSLQALTAPSAICIADMLDASINKAQPTMFINIGLQSGVLLRTVLDLINGLLKDTRTR